ncbi:MAG: helix-turn-helix domain-containing protein [Deltaproteobacteria bacterium]|nr:helix-turn-helix domain-containing protein [Deltaproteobacteria bacterium]
MERPGHRDSPGSIFAECERGPWRRKADDAQIAAALAQHGGRLRATARALGMSHTTLRKWIKRAPPDSPVAKYKR